MDSLAQNNQRMSHFLFVHIHWLWAAFHWLRHDIYAPWTFGVFVFIGIAQTIIAWESGELAVRALTKDLLGDNERGRYLRLVRILALLLLPATIFIGVVNDLNQRDADDKAAQARADQRATQSKLDEANDRAILAEASFNEFTKTLDPSKFTVVQFAQLMQATKDVARATPTQPSAAPGPIPGGPPVLHPPIPIPAESDSETTARLLSDLSSKISGLRRSHVTERNNVLGHGMPYSQCSPDRTNLTASCVDQIKRMNAGELNQYLAFHEEMSTLVDRALVLLRLPPSEVINEKSKLTELDRAASQPYPIPKTSTEAYSEPVQYFPIAQYLDELARRLRSTNPSPKL